MEGDAVDLAFVVARAERAVMALYPPASFSHRSKVRENRDRAAESTSLALERLREAEEELAYASPDADVVANALSDASAHLAVARDWIEGAFRGIRS